MISFDVREYKREDIPFMREIWNEVVKEGIAFPQTEQLNAEQAEQFFGMQDTCSVAVDNESGEIIGLYILHPNNIGRCSHIANASYAVSGCARGKHIGEQLVLHSMKTAKKYGYRILQFNAVVKSNIYARHLYEKIGFRQLGVIPKGFRLDDGTYEDICPYYIEL